MQNFSYIGTRLIRISLKFIFIREPARTSLGVLMGVLLQAIITLLNPLLSQYNNIVDFASLSIFQYTIFGIILVYLPLIISFIFSDKTQINDESVEMLLRTIDRIKEDGKLTDEQVQPLYLKVIEKVVEKTQLKQDVQKELNEINQNIAQQLLEGETKQELPRGFL
ncbi:MAG: hypothetical protein QNJ64_11400 [Crocosphaera sp.]|nr:hypothetical protein [Crocosphaera sp.]